MPQVNGRWVDASTEMKQNIIKPPVASARLEFPVCQSSVNHPPLYTRLRQDLIHDTTMHIGQAKLATLEPVRQLGVVQSQAMQNCGLQVVDMNGTFFHSHA